MFLLNIQDSTKIWVPSAHGTTTSACVQIFNSSRYIFFPSLPYVAPIRLWKTTEMQRIMLRILLIKNKKIHQSIHMKNCLFACVHFPLRGLSRQALTFLSLKTELTHYTASWLKIGFNHKLKRLRVDYSQKALPEAYMCAFFMVMNAVGKLSTTSWSVFFYEA